MKTSHKILTALLAVIIIASICIIISVKKKDNIINPDVQVKSSYQPPESQTNSGELPNNNAQDDINNNHSHDHTHTAIKPQGQTDKQSNQTNAKPSTNNKPTQQKKEYDLTNSEEIQSQKTSFGQLKLYSTFTEGKKIYLFVMDNGKTKFYKEMPGSYIIENIYYANIDGKFGDEIFIRAKTNSSDKPATYENHVLKVTPNGFESLIDITPASLGFSATIDSNYNVKIINSKTKMSKNINIKDIKNSDFTNEIWNESGKIISSVKPVFEKNAFTIEPVDVDDDGIYEILFTQYVSLGKNKDCIGYARATLKYNHQSNKIEVINTYFNLP